MFYFDPMYFVFAAPAMLLALYAQFRVKSAYQVGSRVPASSGMSGAQAARRLLDSNGLTNVKIEQVQGHLSDHYDPKSKVLRLSPEVYSGTSLASLGIAAHETGHALQDSKGYTPLKLRNGIVPLASIGSSLSWFVMLGGFLLGSFNLVMLGIALFSTAVVFQLINLPVEFDASARARKLLQSSGFVAAQEDRTVGSVLNAAALTYVAATISSVMTLLYYLWRFGLFGGSDD